jgi:hypothetical protein
VEEVKSTGRTVLLLDAGDFIAREGRTPEKNSIQLMIAARFMLDAMDWLGYAAANAGEGDLVFGDTFLKEIAAPLSFPVVTNSILLDGRPVFPGHTVAVAGGVRAGVVGVTSDAFGAYVLDHADPGRPLTVRALDEAARRGLDLVAQGVDLKILLAHAPLPAVRALLEAVPGYDIVISGHDTDEFAVIEPEVIRGAHLVQTGWDGKYMGRLDLTLNQEGTLVAVAGSETALDATWPDHPHMVALHEEYLARVAEAIEEILEAYPVSPPPTGGQYVGATECRTCHLEEWRSWRETKHALAWRTLQDRHRDYDPECFACHTTGFQYEGGFRLITETPLMADVQCETCHGAGADHGAAPALPYARPDEATCTRCHVPLHSPDFDYETYLPKILHGTQAPE